MILGAAYTINNVSNRNDQSSGPQLTHSSAQCIKWKNSSIPTVSKSIPKQASQLIKYKLTVFTGTILDTFVTFIEVVLQS